MTPIKCKTSRAGLVRRINSDRTNGLYMFNITRESKNG